MGDIIDLAKGRKHLAAKKGFRNWNRRFREDLDEYSTPGDLRDATLYRLIKGEHETGEAVEQFVIGVQLSKCDAPVAELNAAVRMEVMDATLFVLDQLRFEAMRRLGWLEESPLSDVPLVDMVLDFASKYSSSRHQTPAMAEDHPKYGEYISTFEGDRGAFIRRLIPEMIEAFGKRSDQQ